jgi:rod shape determining protein RodA
VLLALALTSSIFGIILISSVPEAFRHGAQVEVQIGAIVIGIGLFVLFSYFDIDIIADKSRFLYVASLLLMSTLLFWGVGAVVGEGDYAVIGRTSWLRFGEGEGGIGIQPGEVVKIPFIIIISKMIANYKERKTIDSFYSIVKIGAVAASMIAVIFETSRDLGTVLTYFLILAIVLLIGGIKFRWFLLGAGMTAVVARIIWDSALLSDNHRERLLAPFVYYGRLDPDRLDVFWQTDWSIRAISEGGFLGQGIGGGTVTQSGILPFQHTDFVFSVAGEALGFVGGMLIVVLLVLMIIRCIVVGIRSNNSLGMLVCSGVAAMLMTHMILNIGMNLGLLPVIGVPLPFFSYGGSSIVTFFAGMGLVSGIKMRPKPARFKMM